MKEQFQRGHPKKRVNHCLTEANIVMYSARAIFSQSAVEVREFHK
jgi:hypothetical protein